MGYTFDDDICVCGCIRSNHDPETGVCILSHCGRFRVDDEAMERREYASDNADLAEMSEDWRA